VYLILFGTLFTIRNKLPFSPLFAVRISLWPLTGQPEQRSILIGCSMQCSGAEPVCSDPDPDLWDRILAVINESISTLLVCVKTINTLGITVAKLFDS
jgi:hypothetical protein